MKVFFAEGIIRCLLYDNFLRPHVPHQGRNMVYLGPIDPYFLAVILIPEPNFPQNFDPYALIKELIPSMFLQKILT